VSPRNEAGEKKWVKARTGWSGTRRRDRRSRRNRHWYAVDQAVGHAAGIEVGAKYINFHAGHGGGDLLGGGIAAGRRIDGVLGQQQCAALGHAQAGFQRIALEGGFVDDVQHVFSLSVKQQQGSLMKSSVASRSVTPREGGEGGRADFARPLHGKGANVP
jgi:hypothetical protein